MSDDRARGLLRSALEEVYVGSQHIEADAVADKLEDLGVALIAPHVEVVVVTRSDLALLVDHGMAHDCDDEVEGCPAAHRAQALLGPRGLLDPT